MSMMRVLSHDGRYISALDMGEQESDPELRELDERRVRRKPQRGHAHRNCDSDEFGHLGMAPLRRWDFGRAGNIIYIVDGRARGARCCWARFFTPTFTIAWY